LFCSQPHDSMAAYVGAADPPAPPPTPPPAPTAMGVGAATGTKVGAGRAGVGAGVGVGAAGVGAGVGAGAAGVGAEAAAGAAGVGAEAAAGAGAGADTSASISAMAAARTRLHRSRVASASRPRSCIRSAGKRVKNGLTRVAGHGRSMRTHRATDSMHRCCAYPPAVVSSLAMAELGRRARSPLCKHVSGHQAAPRVRATHTTRKTGPVGVKMSRL
jgi:hypothetical protein